MKIHSVGAELFYVDGRTEGRTGGRKEGQTDMTKQIVPFRSFASAPKMFKHSYLINRQIVRLLTNSCFVCAAGKS
jgi:hypothetical protein